MSKLETILPGQYRHITTGTIYNRVTEQNGVYTVTNEKGSQYFVSKDKLERILEPKNIATEDNELRDKINARIDGQFIASIKAIANGDTTSSEYYLEIVKKNIKSLITSEVTKAELAMLDRLEKQQKICYDCNHDNTDIGSMPYIPLSAITNERNILKGKK